MVPRLQAALEHYVQRLGAAGLEGHTLRPRRPKKVRRLLPYPIQSLRGAKAHAIAAAARVGAILHHGPLHRLAHPLGFGIAGGAVVQIDHTRSSSCSMRRRTRTWFSSRMRSAASAPWGT